MRTQFTFHTDPGHGWLAVKRSEVIELGIADKISRYSYQNGDSVYLEEDCDASLFVIEYEKKFGIKPLFIDSYKENTPIRRYASYIA